MLSSQQRQAQYAIQRDAYLALREVWRDSPQLYVRQRFGVEPTAQQCDALEAILLPGAKVTIRSGHGTGKSAVSSMVICWFLETHDYAKVPCTAPTAHQLRDILWGELSKWRRHADELSSQRGDHSRFWLSKLFKLTSERMYDVTAQEWAAVARTARKEAPEALQGFHADHLLFVIDEASGVPEEVFEAAEGALSTPGARVLMLGNPTRNTGTFARSHKESRGEYTPLHFKSQDSPLVDPQYRERLVRKFGEGSNVVRVRCDGEFPKHDDDVLISIELTEPCTTRERREGVGPRKLGVDPARFGNDRTTLLFRHGPVTPEARIFTKQDTMVTVGCVVQAVQDWAIDEVYVDVIGLGAGVYDRLKELQRDGMIACEVIPVNVAETAPPRQDQDAQGKTLRDYLWLEMAAYFRDEQPVFCVPERQVNEDLAGELCTPKFRMDSNGRIVIEPKDDMKKRLGHSPDLADALACTFAPRKNTLLDLDFGAALDGLTSASAWR